VVALVLDLAGVTTESIAADYALSGGCVPETIVGTLAHLRGAYGSVPDYLIGSGMTPAQLNAIRGRLIS
jgi:protein-tyrosine phosphatase